MSENIKAYAVKQDSINYDEENLVMLQAQLINKDYVGKVMVEKVSKDAESYAAGKYYIPGVAVNFGEHPVEAGHRILTEELEVKDREIKYVSTQSHWNDERKHWYVLFIFETLEPLTEEEMKNTCKGIDELVYIDLEDATTENATQGLIDIREAMRNPSKTYI
ncbi:MAG: NUDIX domain-containing protein [Candidatus Thermoplasmatota archaeon]|nr:NUDIX domain-containing protein [Candidatus Thermoplasmatota archaeon]